MFGALLSQSLSSRDAMTIVLVGFLLTTGAVIAVTAIIAHAFRSVAAVRLEIALKRELIERGKSAEDIARVINTHTNMVDDTFNLPCASEVVVKGDDDDWYPALVLQLGNGRYFIHYVGHEMDDNEWVDEDRIRFPARSEVRTMLAQFGANGVPPKEPMEAEI